MNCPDVKLQPLLSGEELHANTATVAGASLFVRVRFKIFSFFKFPAKNFAFEVFENALNCSKMIFPGTEVACTAFIFTIKIFFQSFFNGFFDRLADLHVGYRADFHVWYRADFYVWRLADLRLGRFLPWHDRHVRRHFIVLTEIPFVNC